MGEGERRACTLSEGGNRPRSDIRKGSEGLSFDPAFFAAWREPGARFPSWRRDRAPRVGWRRTGRANRPQRPPECRRFLRVPASPDREPDKDRGHGIDDDREPIPGHASTSSSAPIMAAVRSARNGTARDFASSRGSNCSTADRIATRAPSSVVTPCNDPRIASPIA